MKRTFQHFAAKSTVVLLMSSLLVASGIYAKAFGPLTKGASHSATPAPAPVHDKWAVIVGCNQFQDPSLPPIQFAVRNASGLAAVLKDPNIGRFGPDHVATISGIHATKSGIEQAIGDSWLLKKALPNDLIVLYFCTRIAPSKGDVNLCAFDTLASESDSSGISLVQMLKTIKSRTQSHRIICILDTSPADETNPGAVSGPDISRASGVSLLLANKLGSPSYDSSLSTSSFFLHFLMEGLKAGSGMMTLNAVSQYVAQGVAGDVLKVYQKEEHPEFAVAADASDLPGLALGLPLKETGLGLSGVRIGHRLDTLQMSRPDLAQKLSSHQSQPAKAEDKDDDDDDEPTGNVDFGAYMAKMKQTIQKKWQPPKGFENRRVVTVFTILRDGTIFDPTIVEGTGVESVDKAAMDALHAASPLDPLPLGAPKSVQIRYQFDWHVTRNQ